MNTENAKYNYQYVAIIQDATEVVTKLIWRPGSPIRGTAVGTEGSQDKLIKELVARASATIKKNVRNGAPKHVWAIYERDALRPDKWDRVKASKGAILE